jgi:hypothetical protein
VCLPAYTKVQQSNNTKKMKATYLSAQMMLRNANGKSANVDGLKQEIEIAKQSEKFEFHAYDNDDDKKTASEIVAVEIDQVASRLTGEIRNTATLVFKDGSRVSARLFGTGKATMPKAEIKGDDLKKVTFGYCTTGGEIVRDQMVTPTGVVNVRRRYANVEKIFKK